MNIANKLTLSRIIMIPLFIFLLLKSPFDGNGLSSYQFFAGLIFVVASFTDYLDGYLARKFQLITSFGEFFDPMADKLLVISALLIFVEKGVLPSWPVIIIVARELMITGLRVLLAQQNGKVLAAALLGKIKTFTQMFAIIFLLFNNFGMVLNLGMYLFYISVFFTFYSGMDYFSKATFLFKDL